MESPTICGIYHRKSMLSYFKKRACKELCLTAEKVEEMFLKANYYASGHFNQNLPALVAITRSCNLPSEVEFIKREAALAGSEKMFLSPKASRPSEVEIKQMFKQLRIFLDEMSGFKNPFQFKVISEI